MDKTQLAGFIRSNIGAAEVAEGKQFCEVTVPPSELHKTAAFLRDDENLRFNFLFCLTGVDWGKELGVVYHLRSTEFNHSIVLKTRTAERENPVIDSVSDLWMTAEYHEREVFDLLGIKFANHPDLRRFFLEDSAGHPLRKDFVDVINIVTK